MFVTQLDFRMNGAAVFYRYFTVYGICALYNQVFSQYLVCSDVLRANVSVYSIPLLPLYLFKIVYCVYIY